ncbi:unnamed protein product [Meganyctiphanes norvegica]|uniref:Uncharacterized protein n=1 Tax=Meganyctiphanes norvegica TaxID=48144 RepID=A0AAV2RZR3_MEGNR
MSSSIAPEQQAPRAVGLNVEETEKTCRNIVEGVLNPKLDKLTKVFLRTTDKATNVPAKGIVQGEIPSWVEGNLYRDGPGVFNIGDTWYKHFFDGMAVIHKFHIKNGEAHYNSRILESNSYQKNASANRIVCDEFATRSYPDLCMTTMQKFMSHFTLPNLDDTTDNCAVNVGYYGDRLFAMTETNMMREIDPNTLQTIGERTNISKYLAVNMATAHPHIGPDGTVYNMGNSYMGSKGPTYNVIQFPPPKTQPDGTVLSPMEQASVVATLPCQWKFQPGYYHSFSMTENYFILIEQPMGMSVPKLLYNTVMHKSLLDAIVVTPDAPTRFRLVNRKDGKEVDCVFQADTFYTFHQINAYEEEGQVIVDIVAYEDADVIQSLWLENVLKPVGETQDYAMDGLPQRYVLPMNYKEAPVDTNLINLKDSKARAVKTKSGKIHCYHEAIAEGRLEMPRINYKYNAKKYQYIYGFIADNGKNSGKLVKVDAKTGKRLMWQADKKVCISEPVFVERPEATEEDDGVLLASLLHEDYEKMVQLVVLDARTMEQLALVTFATMGTVTKDLHGMFAQTGNTVHGY